MKVDRRTLLIGAAIVAAALLLSARQGQRPACAGGSCCPLTPGLSLLPSNSWPAIEFTNAKPVQPASESLTNRQQ
jgi:hypothetical protein